MAAGVLLVLLTDLAFRAWGAAFARLERQELQLKKEWDYTSALLARSRRIDENYAAVRIRYPGLFEGIGDRTRIMAELDGAARAVGVQVNTLRPVQGEFDGSTRIELALCGSWPQVMRFFQAAEGQEHMFQFLEVRVLRQEPTTGLAVTAVAQK